MEGIHRLSSVQTVGCGSTRISIPSKSCTSSLSRPEFGCFSAEAEMSAWVVCGGDLIPQPEPKYGSNSPEGDMRLWRHALQSNEQQVFMYSPDTDVYNIGLSLIATLPDTDFILQLNVPYSEEKYLSLNNLEKALMNDPDLATLPQTELGKILQTLFICPKPVAPKSCVQWYTVFFICEAFTDYSPDFLKPMLVFHVM